MRFKTSFFVGLLTISFFLQSTALANDKGHDKKLLDELRVLVEKSRKERAADRWLQHELDDLVARYDWPWQKNILFEDFSDGDFTQNPTWQVLSGEFEVNRGQGLFTEYRRPRESSQTDRTSQAPANDLGSLFGAILEQAIEQNSPNRKNSEPEESRPTRNEPSSIRLQQHVTNDFSIAMSFRQSDQQGTLLNLSLMQSQSSQYGYRLHLQSGESGYIELERIQRGRSSIVASKKLKLHLNNRQLHDLSWTQTADGLVTVSLNNQVMFKTSDRAFRDDYQWLQLDVNDGDLGVQSIRID